MKVFFRKLHKIPLVLRILFLGTIIFYGVAYFFIFKSLLSLTGIENFIRYLLIVLFGFYYLFYILLGLLKLFKKKKVSFIVVTFITLIMAGGFFFASSYIDKFYGMIDKVTAKETSTYTSVLLTMKENDFSSSSKIGMITDEKDRTGYILPWELINSKKLGNEIMYYADYGKLLEAFYNLTFINLGIKHLLVLQNFPFSKKLLEDQIYLLEQRKMS